MAAPFGQAQMNETQARAFWIVEPGRGEIRSTPFSRLNVHEVRVRTLYSALSLGTELLIFRGGVPKSQYKAMRAPFQEGDFPGPVKYGYCNVGVVEDGPKDIKGRTVFCLYPHQDTYLVAVDAVVPLPDVLPPKRAVLAANMETAINGLWDAGPLMGCRIAVVGAGVVGCMMAALASRIPGTDVQLLDINPEKAAVASDLKVAFAAPDLYPGNADIVVEATGATEGLETALALAGFEASVVVMSWYGDAKVPLSLGGNFHSRRLKIISSQVSAVAPSHRARWSNRDRLELALGLLKDEIFDHLITDSSHFEDLPETLAALSSDPSGTLCHVIGYGDP
jgi:threonine dehydrogenase-like Zn-dependent dehydrogenase